MKSGDPSNVEMAKAFLRTLLGPLSRQELQTRYPANNEDNIDYERLYQDLEGGHLDPYLYLTRLSSFLEFFKLKSFIPRFLDRPDGQRIPIDNKEFDLTPPDDLNGFQHFLVNGPPKLTVERYLSGDILEMTYREDTQTTGIVKDKDRVVTILLYDISSSMKRFRSTVQGALKAAFADMNQRESDAGLAEHIIYAIPFGAHAGRAERYEGRADFLRFFNANMNAPRGSDSDTVFANALNSGLEFIAKEAKSERGLKRANILMTTDGEDRSFSFADLEEQRKEIPKDVELSLSVVAIEAGNSQMTEAVKSGEALKYFDRFQYRHMTGDEIAQLFARDAILHLIRDLASSVQFKPGTGIANLIHLSQSLSSLEVRRLSQVNWDHLRTERAMNAYKPKTETGELDRVFELLFYLQFPHEMSKSDLRVEKLNMLSGFLDLIAKEKSQAADQVWGGVGSEMLTRLKEWIGS
jgi:hypothetical protein